MAEGDFIIMYRAFPHKNESQLEDSVNLGETLRNLLFLFRWISFVFINVFVVLSVRSSASGSTLLTTLRPSKGSAVKNVFVCCFRVDSRYSLIRFFVFVVRVNCVV